MTYFFFLKLVQICFWFWQLDPRKIIWRSSVPPAAHRSVVDQHTRAKSRDLAFPLSYLLSLWTSPGPAGDAGVCKCWQLNWDREKVAGEEPRIRAPISGLLLLTDSHRVLLAAAGVTSKPCVLQQLPSGERPEAANPGLSALEPFETVLSRLPWISSVTFKNGLKYNF